LLTEEMHRQAVDALEAEPCGPMEAHITHPVHVDDGVVDPVEEPEQGNVVEGDVRWTHHLMKSIPKKMIAAWTQRGRPAA